MASADLKKKNTELETLQAELAAVKLQLAESKKAKPLSLKVSQKGAVSVYGLGRFPVTLYPGQMARLLSIKEEIETFIDENKASLSYKS
tara:strand:- start:562 stop:828 length:267 start_codon:yes stop_codon:yes gene_type:complete